MQAIWERRIGPVMPSVNRAGDDSIAVFVLGFEPFRVIGPVVAIYHRGRRPVGLGVRWRALDVMVLAARSGDFQVTFPAAGSSRSTRSEED